MVSLRRGLEGFSLRKRQRKWTGAFTPVGLEALDQKKNRDRGKNVRIPFPLPLPHEALQFFLTTAENDPRVRSWQVLRFFARLRVKELFSSYPSAELFPEGPEETGGDGGRHREAQRPTRSAQPEGASACSSSAPISVSSLVSLGEAANGASSISVSGPSDDCLAPSSSALSPNARSPPSLFLRWQKRGGHLLTSGHAERLRFRCEETAFLLDAVSAKD
mmetsp:Transcript_42005/g.82920  ORF Transcript_42005/g.82920 Transcript_42005/m.82920 type:complete len:219 (+) Transcript_42005:451-1107(+)